MIFYCCKVRESLEQENHKKLVLKYYKYCILKDREFSNKEN